MFTILGMMIAGMLGLIFGGKLLDDRHKLKIIEAKKQAQLAIDAQRYEKIKEILTDGIISDQPTALEALKPLIEVIALQMQGEEAPKLLELEHNQQLALIEARNQPFSGWMAELAKLRKSLARGEITSTDFQRCVQAITESTAKLFGVSFQTVPVLEEQKALPGKK